MKDALPDLITARPLKRGRSLLGVLSKSRNGCKDEASNNKHFDCQDHFLRRLMAFAEGWRQARSYLSVQTLSMAVSARHITPVFTFFARR
jgi:hypothetical protein